MRDLNKFRHSLAQSKEETTNYQGQLTSRLTNLKLTVEDLKEKTWKLDVNTRSNLVFYGIKEDGNCCNAEFSVKEVRGEGTTKKGGGSFLGLQRLLMNRWSVLLSELSESLSALLSFSPSCKDMSEKIYPVTNCNNISLCNSMIHTANRTFEY